MQFAELNAEQLEYASDMLKSMAHPIRIALLNALDGGKNHTVTELYEILDIEQAVASHHLSILKNKGIVACKRDGKKAYYFIKNEHLITMLDCLNKCACKQ